MDSDSDENLEEVSFLQKQPDSGRSNVSVVQSNGDLVSSVAKSSFMLDALLSEHKEETEKAQRFEKIQAELKCENVSDPSQINDEEGEKALCPELEKVIDDLDVKSAELQTIHPTLQIFNSENFCSLFGEDLHPFSWGFTPKNSQIDQLLADIKPDALVNFLLSDILHTCFHKVSCLQTIMMWLFSIISIHSSDLIIQASSRSMMSILRKLKLSKLTSGQIEDWWCPTPLQLLSIFVNMEVFCRQLNILLLRRLSANPSELVYDHSLYTEEDIRKHLAAFDNKTRSNNTKSDGSVSLSNFQHLFDILARCLQSRPNFTKEELNAIFFMIMKISMDDIFKELRLQRLFQVCISSILECYSDSDWPAVVPELCQQISCIPDHHHSAAYLTELLPIGERGRYLQIRLSYLMLCTILEPDQEGKNLDIPNISFMLLAGLGHSRVESDSGNSRLTDALQSLAQSDIYKMRSALHLLDRAAGDEINRCKQPKHEVDYLISQVKEVTKRIRDCVFGLELSRIKDIMSYMTFKWTLVSAQNSKCVQRSIFQWVTSTSHTFINEEVLKESQSQSSEEEDEMENIKNVTEEKKL